MRQHREANTPYDAVGLGYALGYNHTAGSGEEQRRWTCGAYTQGAYEGSHLAYRVVSSRLPSSKHSKWLERVTRVWKASSHVCLVADCTPDQSPCPTLGPQRKGQKSRKTRLCSHWTTLIPPHFHSFMTNELASPTYQVPQVLQPKDTSVRTLWYKMTMPSPSFSVTSIHNRRPLGADWATNQGPAYARLCAFEQRAPMLLQRF